MTAYYTETNILTLVSVLCARSQGKKMGEAGKYSPICHLVQGWQDGMELLICASCCMQRKSK